jgi:hypothetical protein
MNVKDQIMSEINKYFEDNRKSLYYEWCETTDDSNLYTSLDEEIEKTLEQNPQLDKNDPEVKNKAKFLFFYKQFQSFIFRINSHYLGEDKLMIYRALSVENTDKFMDQLASEDSQIGKHWSFVAGKAQAYEGNGQDLTIKLHGFVSPESVDYKTTILKGLSIRYSHENEIVMIDGMPVIIHRIDVFDKSQNLINSLSELKIKVKI